MSLPLSVRSREARSARPLATLGSVGRWALESISEVGSATLFLAGALRRVVRWPPRALVIVEHVHFIGNRSLLIIALTGAFTGLVLALQGYNALERFGAEQMVGALVALSLTRELAPVLGALMVTARAGSAIAATLGNMRVTEQIDALETMAIDPMDYLVAPRIVAGLVAIPLLTVLFTLTGLAVAHVFCVEALGMESAALAASIHDAIETPDVIEGVTKSLVFALLIVWVSTYRGFHARGGAKGVGQATTRAVVDVAVLILATDYALTALLF